MAQNHSTTQEKKISDYNFMTTSNNQHIRYGIWYSHNEKNTGAVLLLNGRKEFMEKYAETIRELNQRGFNVYSLDWRGQGLSSRMLANRHKGFIKNYDIYLYDLNRFVIKIVQPEASAIPLVILAHSMGGHVALRFIHEHPELVDKAVLVSPMIDILTSPLPGWFVRLIARLAILLGLDHAYIIGSGNYTVEKFKNNRLTSDPERFMDENKAIAENPDLALGGVTYGWLSATFESIDIITEPDFAKKITTPILIASAGCDRVVSIKAQKVICSLLPNCRFAEITGARHEILKETDTIRSIFWDKFDRFTRTGIDPMH
ncbi:MAG: alpha/beta hydrolase [Desulfobacterales bacterium]|jgi:lysophospholipase